MPNKRQALIVESDPIVATELGSLLTNIGFKVTRTEEPESVAQMLEGREYEVALMNMPLPGMNWRRTILTIKKSARTTTIMVMKQSPDEDDVRLALNAGAYILLDRPISQEKFSNLISPGNDGMFVALRD